MYHKEYDGVIIVRQFRPAVSLSRDLLALLYKFRRRILLRHQFILLRGPTLCASVSYSAGLKHYILVFGERVSLLFESKGQH